MKSLICLRVHYYSILNLIRTSSRLSHFLFRILYFFSSKDSELAPAASSVVEDIVMGVARGVVC